jgi:hypothetical protein
VITGEKPEVGLLSPDGVLTGDHAKYQAVKSAQALLKKLMGGAA